MLFVAPLMSSVEELLLGKSGYCYWCTEFISTALPVSILHAKLTVKQFDPANINMLLIFP